LTHFIPSLFLYSNILTTGGRSKFSIFARFLRETIK
jgi:actin-related protein